MATLREFCYELCLGFNYWNCVEFLLWQLLYAFEVFESPEGCVVVKAAFMFKYWVTIMYSFFPRIEKMLRDKIMSWRPRFVTRWNRLVVKFQCLNLGPCTRSGAMSPWRKKKGKEYKEKGVWTHGPRNASLIINLSSYCHNLTVLRLCITFDFVMWDDLMANA